MTDNGIRADARGTAREQSRGRNAALQEQVDALLAGLHEQTEALAAAQGAVANTTAQAESPDGLVRVTVDSSGAVVAVDFDPSTFTRTTPARLADVLADTARTAVAEVRARIAELMAPVAALTADFPDLPDLVAGAPSIRNLVPTVATEFAAGTEHPSIPAQDDDLHDWREPIMREAHRG
ncbi:YbaB/EbfC family nucleoid-associated protein [Rhodococcus sp. W8901]|uniref:YbaB/EbfC family nucleoid-associated protein n=1 Tax=Rhodococcus sp. W8901 TaxID=2742603 RepID=UPI00158148B6|nr:YbaB/EbfC family nucleoid-associated protein [Rhodococcus sp. W8901]QKT12967.1 YbaB/EbfC family nucleoid-associated protein [Rhodococcus sp. W8901]